MEQEWKLLEKLIPEMTASVLERYKILQHIFWLQPIGRRVLAEKIGLSERSLRTDIEDLREHNLIRVTKSGMYLTQDGKNVFKGLEPFIDALWGRKKIEEQIQARFNIKECFVVEGNVDENPQLLVEFSKLVNHLLAKELPSKKNVISVMGGTTMAALANYMLPLEEHQQIIFVPARGGIGERVAIQANSIASVMAQKTKSAYRALFVPEQLSQETYKPLLQEPIIQEVLQLIGQSEAVIFSIGKALHMAARRNMKEKDLVMLKKNHAVAESFGYFFDEKGKVVYKLPRIGLQLKDLNQIPLVIAVVGGKSKGKAVKAYLKNTPKQTRLIIDLACAKEILKGETL